MDTEKIIQFLQRPKVIITGSITLLVIFFLLWGVSTYTDVRNEGRAQELGLTAQWKTMMSNYGQFRLRVVDELNIAREKRDAIDKILVDSVTGRYDKNGQTGAVDRQAVVSAIAEAYPDLKGLNIYDSVLKDIQAGRERFAKDQEQTADMVRSYNDWRSTGSFLHPTFARWAGFPSPLLEARVGGQVYHGQEALDKMSLVIVGNDTAKIFETGTDQALPSKP